MNLTWHVVRKDLRRFAWPVSAWVAFLLLVALAVQFAFWKPEKVTANGAADWCRTLRAATLVAGLVATSAVVLLAGVIGLEDRVSGTVSFWQTRPLAGMRLLCAKVAAVVLLLVLAPVVAMLPVWLAAGWDGTQILLGAVALATWFGLLGGLALTLAALCENLGQQAFAALVWLGLTMLAGMVLPTVFGQEEAAVGLVWTRAYLAALTVGGGTAAALGWQYWTRRTRLGWTVLGLGFAVGAAVGLGWQWDWSGEAKAPSEAAAAGITGVMVRASGDQRHPAKATITVTGDLRPGELIAPLAGAGVLHRGDGTTARMRFWSNGRWGSQAAGQLVGLPFVAEPPSWDLATWLAESANGEKREGGPRWVGRINFARVRGRLLYELPVRAGSAASQGAYQTRIIGWVEGEPASLMVEEHAPMLALPTLGRSRVPLEAYAVVQRARGEGREVLVRNVGMVGANGLGVSLKILEVMKSGAAGKAGDAAAVDWREGAILLKVHFEPVEFFSRDFPALPLGSADAEARR